MGTYPYKDVCHAWSSCNYRNFNNYAYRLLKDLVRAFYPKLQLNIRVQEKLPVKAIAVKVNLFIIFYV